MSEPLGKFAHRHVSTGYSVREGGGVVARTEWEGIASGYGTVFGSLILDVPKGATGGDVQWVGQSFPPGTDFVTGSGTGTWEQINDAQHWKITIPAIEISNGDRVRCEGLVDLATRTFTGEMYQAD